MNPHQIIVDYLVAKGYDSWRVGIDATRAARQIEAITERCPLCSGKGWREVINKGILFETVCRDCNGQGIRSKRKP